MRIDKKFIENFNKNKTKNGYEEIIDKFFIDAKKCRICKGCIYYYDSTFSVSGELLTLKGKSYLTSKFLDIEYKLSVCEDCLSLKFPEYQEKNKSRVFNQLNYLTEFAFGIPKEVGKSWMKEKYAITELNLIRKWGEDEGKKRWGVYCQKQSLKNTYEHKRDKYGWTKEKFDEFNKSRSVTLENLVNRHGEEQGLIIWKEYCDKQKYTTSVEYFIEKHGPIKGVEIYENFCKKRLFGAGYSQVSKNFFDKVSENFKDLTLFYGENEWYSYDISNKKYYLIDFYIEELNIGIEFNGDIWHANPKKYSASDKPFPFQKNMTASEVWQRDKLKNDFLQTKLTKLIIIWESDLYQNGINSTVDSIIKQINE